MNKKYLSVILFGALLTVSMGTFTSCKDYDDDIDSLDQRITSVEKSLEDLKARINAGAVITNVTSTANGVTVTLSDNKTFELKNGTNGTNGTDGTNGTNGTVVTIGENGNWFFDGKDSGLPSRGIQGEAGNDGNDGNDGVSAPTIYYYPGTDGAEAGFWVKMTKAVDGKETKEVTTIPCIPEGKEAVSAIWDTENGYLILNNVDKSEGPVKIKLTDTLRSLAFVPETIDTKLGMGVIDFYSLLVYNNTSKKNEFLVSNNPLVTYRLNPQNADVKNVEWSFIDRVVETRVAGDNESLLKIMNAKKGEEGGMIFQLQSTKTLDYLKANQEAIFALKATNKEDATEIVSDYAVVKASELKEYGIAKIKDGKATTTPVSYYPTTVPALNVPADVEFIYTGELNLSKITEAWAKEIEKSLASIGVENITYEYAKPEKYLGSDGKTNQQQFVTAPDKNGVVVVDKAWLAQGTASVGRTPIFTVTAKVNGTVVASGYVKAEITAVESVEKGDLPIAVALGNIEYSSIATPYNKYELSWDRANAEIYDVLGMTKETFQQNYYETYNVTQETGVTASGWTYASNSTTETAMAWIEMTPKVLLGEGTAKVTYTAKNNFVNKNVVITFTYNVVHTKAFPELNPDYLIGTNIVQVKGKMVGNSWKLVSEMKEQFKNYMSGYQLPGNHTKLYFRLKGTNQTGASISGTDYKDQEIKLTTPFAKNETSRDYNIEMVADLSNGKECVKEYVVRFVRPFNATVDAMTLKTYMANHDSKDLASLVVIKDRDGKTVYEKGAYTTYGKDTYKLDQANITFGYGLKADASFGDKLTIAGSTIDWYNGGNDLQLNKSAKSVVTITIPEIATIEAEGNITVLSTENSKN